MCTTKEVNCAAHWGLQSASGRGCGSSPTAVLGTSHTHSSGCCIASGTTSVYLKKSKGKCSKCGK